MKPRVVFIIGPTGVGKSKLAFQLARRINGEIISADSMQVYRGMDIGTAKPSVAERKKVPHHLIDIVAPSCNFSVYKFRKRALKIIDSVFRRGTVPIVVGGTGLYIRSLLEGLVFRPGADMKLRRAIEAEIVDRGLDYAYKKLMKIDPLNFQKIKPADKSRIVRGLEVHALTKKRTNAIPELKEPSLSELGYDVLIFGLSMDRALLYKAIERRVDGMFRKGWVAEVRRLKRQRLSRTARCAIGYREILQGLQSGGFSPAAKALIKQNTRRFAKRQLTWFRREKGVFWFDFDSQANDDILDRIEREMKHETLSISP